MNFKTSKLYGLSVGLALCMLAWIAYRTFGSPVVSLVIAIAGIAYAVAFYLMPGIQPSLIEGFHRATLPIRWTMTLLVLAMVYFLVLTPIAFWYRWSGKSIRRNTAESESGESESNWQPANIPTDNESYFRTY